jgi:hypothetical protein
MVWFGGHASQLTGAMLSAGMTCRNGLMCEGGGRMVNIGSHTVTNITS